MARHGARAHRALVACARAHEVDICIHQVGQPVWRIAPDVPSRRPYALHVVYHSWEHYSSVRLKNGPADGPANIPSTIAAAPGVAAAALPPRKRADPAAPTWKENAVMTATGCSYARKRI